VNRYVDRLIVETLRLKLGIWFTFIEKGHVTNWQFDWGGRL